MQFIVLIPAFIAAYVAFSRSPQKAFMQVYLPVLFLVPDYYRWIVAGLPDPTFSEATIIHIAIAYFMRGAQGWRYTLTDLLVLGFAVCEGLSQFLASGYNDAQNLIFDMICIVILPYVLAKGIIEPSGLRVDFAKKFVTLLAIVTIGQAYEFRFINNVFKMIFNPFFPYQGYGWVTTIRSGLGRAAGPYGHAILCGVLMATGFRIQRWLQQQGHWPTKRKAQLMTTAMVAGMVMTQSRGPWLGAMLGSTIVIIGRAKNRKTMLATVLTLAVVIGTPAYLAFQAYVSVGRDGATSDTQETAAYRKELIDKYTDIALQKAWLGWGQNEWPKVPGMPSIDNHFLNLAIRHGMVTVGFFVLIVFSAAVRLGIYAYNAPREAPGSSLAFSMLAALLAIVISIVTVYLGLQAQQLLFMMAGWTEGPVTRKEEPAGENAFLAPVQQPLFRFRRVLK